MSAISRAVSESGNAAVTGTQHSQHSEHLTDIEHAALHYTGLFNTTTAFLSIQSIIFGPDLTPDTFYAGAQGALQDLENEAIISMHLIRSYANEQSMDTKRGILKDIAEYFKEAEPPTKREIFIISPSDSIVEFFVRCGIFNHTLTVTGYTRQRTRPPAWVERLLEEVVAAIRVRIPDL
ncbi:hypothetical protein FLAG1_08567 [Fusarium langsethiae]|uniref:Uncharacterized protein n=1 Tax=Fusarium langsethiae TaxID=179993 RepID=A0A0M9ESA5_FUSLA|nr:hypothetical protein FLAG1_08567 [Fusarium langsethiae]GKU20967.1 unnamed protein product [Fusarium langsethiae]